MKKNKLSQKVGLIILLIIIIVNRIPLKQLMKSLGYTDLKAVKRWCLRNDVAILNDNRRLFVIEETFTEKFHHQVDTAIKANDIKPVPVKIKHYRPESKMAADFLNNIK